VRDADLAPGRVVERRRRERRRVLALQVAPVALARYPGRQIDGDPLRGRRHDRLGRHEHRRRIRAVLGLPAREQERQEPHHEAEARRPSAEPGPGCGDKRASLRELHVGIPPPVAHGDELVGPLSPRSHRR
jgi:hypothetical protein